MLHTSKFMMAQLAAIAFLGVMSPAFAQDEAALLAEAKKEGKVVFYTSYVSPQLHTAVAAGFEKKYGIPVEVLNPRASELEERIRTEQAAGRFIGDVIQHGQASITRLYRAGNVQEHGGVPNMKNMIDGQPAEPHDSRGHLTVWWRPRHDRR